MVMLVRKPVKYVLEVPADHESRFEDPPSMMQADEAECVEVGLTARHGICCVLRIYPRTCMTPRG